MDSFITIIEPPQLYGTYLTLRVTDNDPGNLEKIAIYLRSVSKVIIVVQEISYKEKKLHIHALFQTTLKKSGFIQAFHKHFKDKYVGNQSYSCSVLEKEPENYIIYCCKGTRNEPPKVLYKAEWVDSQMYWEHYWSDKPIELDNTIKVAKKKKAITWSQALTNELERRYPHQSWSYTEFNVKIMTREVLIALGQQSKNVPVSTISGMVKGQMNALNYRMFGDVDERLYHHVLREGFPDLFEGVCL